MAVDLNGVQALVTTLYRRPISRHLFFRFGDRASARAYLGELAHGVTMAGGTLDAAPDPLLNVGVTYDGLAALGMDPALLAKLDAVFKRGPLAVQLSLGDVPGSPSDPVSWWDGQFSTADVHCIVHVYARSDDAVQDATHTVRELAHRNGLTELFPRRDGSTLEGRSLGGAQLHFGYTDGISHPDVCWDDDIPPAPSQVDFRNFLLGYSTREYPSAPAGGPAADFVRGSTYGVFRWLYQDVAAFNLFLSTEGPKLFPELAVADAEELLAAKMMGRWRDGTPLVLSPDRPDPRLANSNDFGYVTQDLDGCRCPFSAHIRVVNPRDTPLDPAEVEGVPRVLRRGMAYGPPLQGNTDDGVDRGLVGVFLCADLRKQIYTLTSWIMRNNFSPVYDANRRVQDPLFGNRAMPGASADFTLPAAGGGATVKNLPDFVRTKGTAFLLYPGKTTLTALSKVIS
ncbi:MAG: Dyp-type peroxidase [Pseudonocardiaceae bacterium]